MIKNILVASILTFGLSFSALANKKAEAKKEAAATTATVTGGIKWTGYGLGKEHTGDLNLKSGQVTLAGDNVTAGTFVFDMSTIAYKDKRLSDHLKSADFFDISKFPTAEFKITKVEAVTGNKMAGSPTHKITGDLTIKGKTHPITFDAVVSKKDGTWTAVGDATIEDRTQFDIVYNSAKKFSLEKLGDKLIKDNIKIALNLTAK